MLIILGLIDLITAFVLLGMALSMNVPLGIMIAVPGLLFLKALPFLLSLDWGSFLDLAIVGLIVLSLFLDIPSGVFYTAAGFLALKGFLSLV